MNQNKKILKFHYEELVFVLMILSTNLKEYEHGDILNFNEAILRLETLAEVEFLKKINQINSNINHSTIPKIVDLRDKYFNLKSIRLYDSMLNESENLFEISLLAREILNLLDEIYIEPKLYAENHMDVTW